MRRWAALLAGVPLVLVLAVPLGVTLAGVGGLAGLGAGDACAATVEAPAAGGGRFSAEQRSIAATAVRVANQRRLPDRAKIVILATGFQESGIRNLRYGDRDSLGWLQQRAGWGSAAQRLDPAYAAGKFFDALVRVPRWETLPVTVAAQAVQISAFPNAYAKWEADARRLLATVGDQPADQCSPTAGGGPVPASFDQQGNPRTVEQAIAMMTTHPYGWGGYGVQGHCEGYMTRAYGWPGGYASALAHWNAPGPRAVGYSTPPRGALVFWNTGGPYGHVALSLGGGVIVSTDFNGRTYQAGRISAGPITAIDKWGTRLGWRAPNFQVGGERRTDQA